MTTLEEKGAGFITLKEASERYGYAPDYLGQLIRKGKIEGKLVYSHVAWVTTPEAIEEYIAHEHNRKSKKFQQKNDEDEILPDDTQMSLPEDTTPHVPEISATVPSSNDTVGTFERFVGDRLLSDRSARLWFILLRLLLAIVIVAAVGLFYIFFEATGGALSGSATHYEAHAFELEVADHHGTR